MQVSLILQDSNTPFTYYTQATATLSGAWQQFTTAGQVNDTGSILLMIQATAPGTFWVDDVEFTGPSGAPVSGGVPWPVTRFGTLRLWDSGTTWTALEPQKGVWNWQPLDIWVAAAEQHGIQDILLTLGQTPAWASSDPSDVNYVGAGAPAPPTNNQDWIDYVTAVAQRYQGRIRYYEIWNEPNDTTYYSGTVAELAELTAEAYSAIKSVDPGNTVLSPAAYAPGYLDELLAAGVGSTVDMIAYHMYETPPEETGAAITNVRLVMAANGIGSMPVWDTEGASGDNTVTEDVGAAYLVRKYLVDLAFGSIRYDWYTWGKASIYCAGTEESDPFQLTEAGRAFGLLVNWLQDASLTGASIDGSGTWQIGLSWPEKPSLRSRANVRHGVIVWNPNLTAEFTIPDDWTGVNQYDVFGNVTAISGSSVMVGDSPVLLQAAPVPAQSEM
jgi:hypothetical protein